MTQMNQNALNGKIVELSFGEIDEVDGGLAPVVLALAVGATYVKFSFVRGVFDGIREKETANPR